MGLKFREEIQIRFGDIIQKAIKSIPFDNINQPIYHFTGKAALINILQQRSLWATLVTDFVDKNEIKYTLDRAIQVIQGRKATGNYYFLDKTIPYLDLNESHAINNLGMKLYVACFSKKENEPEHWEKYGQSGKGSAIAFALRPLIFQGSHPIPGRLVIQVLYEPSRQDDLICKFLKSCDECYAHLANTYANPQEAPYLQQLAAQFTALGIWFLAPAFKEQHYSNENELRVIQFEGDFALGIEPVEEKIDAISPDRHYIELKYSLLPIVELIRGIYSPYKNDDSELKQLLCQATGRKVKIIRSTVYPKKV